MQVIKAGELALPGDGGAAARRPAEQCGTYRQSEQDVKRYA